MVRPLNEVKIHYPEIGEFKANIFGHPEAITFPHHYPDINESPDSYTHLTHPTKRIV